MDYEEMLDAIYNHLIDKPDIDMCGDKSREAIRELKQILTQNVYIDIEELFTAGFEENARNGFYHGFHCAVTLMGGSWWNCIQ